MKYYCQSNLPMDEFAKGNFSQAHKIIDTYREYIAKCITSLTHQNAGGEKTISEYLNKKLIELEQQHKERTEIRIKAENEMEDTKKEIENLKKPLKEKNKGNKVRQTFFNYRDKNEQDTALLKRAFENTKEDNPEKYEINRELFETFFTIAENIDYEKMEKLQKKYYNTKEEKKKAKHMLSNKANRQNLDKQIDNIKKGNEKIRIENQIRKDLLKIFKKIDDMGHINDQRDLQEIFTSFIATQLITNCNTNKKLKKDLIKNHTDKVGLFDHIRNIYQNNSQIFLGIETYRELSKSSEYRESIINEKINEIAEASREILNRLPNISFYFLADRNSPEDIGKQQNTSSEDWKKYVIEDLIIHLKKSLSEQEKKGHWRQEANSKIKKLFEGIYNVTESYEFENYCENLWNIDANKYWEILGTEGKMLLKQIYQAMNEKEQKIIKNSYNTRKFFKKIIKDVKTQKKYEQEKQLKIYDFAPIYNIKGYLEKISTNIESLIGRLELKQKRKFEGIARKMLAEQGYGDYIDTATEIIPLLDEEFIKRVKESKGGKALSFKLKKLEGKLLPDINERITETKKTTKEDII